MERGAPGPLGILSFYQTFGDKIQCRPGETTNPQTQPLLLKLLGCRRGRLSHGFGLGLEGRSRSSRAPRGQQSGCKVRERPHGSQASGTRATPPGSSRGGPRPPAPSVSPATPSPQCSGLPCTLPHVLYHCCPPAAQPTWAWSVLSPLHLSVLSLSPRSSLPGRSWLLCSICLWLSPDFIFFLALESSCEGRGDFIFAASLGGSKCLCKAGF